MPRCTGHVDRKGRLRHSGARCPIHERKPGMDGEFVFYAVVAFCGFGLAWFFIAACLAGR